MITKLAGSFRLTAKAWRLLRALAFQSGIPMTAMLEMLIREAASRKGLK
jgi:hypothetical protein